MQGQLIKEQRRLKKEYKAARREIDFKAAVIARDHGCVFCHRKYRAEDHVPIPYYDYHFHHGKAFGCCEYHSYILHSVSLGTRKQRKEMEDILDDYLKDKEDPKVF